MRLRIIPVLLVFALITAIAVRGQEVDTETPGASRLQLRTIEADLSPSLDVTLPSGSVVVESARSFASLGLALAMQYNFLDNSIGARVAFSYPMGLFLSELIFFDSVDFENTVSPQVSFDEVSLAPSERYVSRRRGGESKLWFSLTPEWRIGPSFVLAEVFRGSLTAGEVQEDAIYYTTRLSTEIDTINSEDLVDDVFVGVEASSSLDWRFRNRFGSPTDLDHVTSLAVYGGLWGDLAVEPRLRFGYPLRVWEGDKTVFYSLGGVETVRGYDPDSIYAYRYALGSLDVRPVVLRRFRIPLRIKSARAQIHRYRLLFLTDVVATQDSTDLQSDIHWRAAAGAGLSMVLSGETGNHFRTRLYMAWPLEPKATPVFYWQTSFFSIERRL